MLGSRKDLAKLAKLARLVTPKTAIEEIIGQKRRYFENQKQVLAGSALIKSLGVTTAQIDDMSFGEIEDGLREDSSIPYSITGFPRDERTFETILQMALRNEAPFGKDGDKGFKDACIALSASTYGARHPEEDVLVVSGGQRLIDYLRGNGRLAHCGSLSEALRRLAAPLEVDGATASTGNCKSASRTSAEAADAEAGEAIGGLRASGSLSGTHSAISSKRGCCRKRRRRWASVRRRRFMRVPWSGEGTSAGMLR